MKKFWMVYSQKRDDKFEWFKFERFETYQAAEDRAKSLAAYSCSEFIILEAVAATTHPAPPIDIVKM